MRINKLYFLCKLIVIFLEVLVTSGLEWVVDDSGCPTPDNGVGICILLNDCKPILDYVAKFSVPNPIAQKTVKSYVCGVENRKLKVCCPYNGQVIEVFPEPIEVTTTVTPSTIENHQKEIEKCTSPAGEGACISAKECEPIKDFIINNSPLNSEDLAILRSYQCQLGAAAKVCCPNKKFEIPSSKHPIDAEPPDVSNHKNLQLLPQDCGVVLSDRIVNGNKTALFEYPWMTLLSYKLAKGGVDFRCGGTIITDWYILTAAHCITKHPTLQLQSVRVGEHDISTDPDCEKHFCASTPQDIDVAEAIPHPKYNSTSFENDIGLIRLARPINSTIDSVKPICLPTIPEQRNRNFENSSLIVTGWGVTETGQRSLDLLQISLPIVPATVCRKAYENKTAKVTQKHICAGGTGIGDSCSGDSGGPLQTVVYYNQDARFMQFGVVSFGPRFCGQEIPGAYTRVDYYMDWVLNNIKPFV